MPQSTVLHRLKSEEKFIDQVCVMLFQLGTDGASRRLPYREHAYKTSVDSYANTP